MGRLDGKVALITGGASGMGMVASELFASEGAKVVLTDVVDDSGEQVAEKIRAGGGEATYVHADVSSESDAKAMVAATRAPPLIASQRLELNDHRICRRQRALRLYRICRR